MKENRAIDASDAHKDPRTREFSEGYLDQLGISSMLDAPIRIDGEICGVVCFEHVGPIRTWLVDEISCAGQAADLAIQIYESDQRRRADHMLAQSQRMESLGKLAGGIAHDFNNMLAGMIGSAELIANLPELSPDKVRRNIDMILKIGDSAAEITGKLLSFAHRHDELSTQVQLDDILSETIEMFERGSATSVTIQKNLRASESVIKGDRGDLQNAFLNLLLNARDAMEERNALLQIETESLTLSQNTPSVTKGCLATGEYVKVSITDNGCGISKEVAEKIFEPFFTTKQLGQGTGLGLSAVYGIVENHNGAIDLTTKEGVGTTFTLYFPEDPLDPSVAKEWADTQLPKDKQQRVLVIDDDSFVLTITTQMLEELGCEVYSAESGPEGLLIFKEHLEMIDCILLDVKMPGMSGEECLHHLRELHPDIPVFIISGYAEEGIVDRMLVTGADGYLKKPFRFKQLADLLPELPLHSSPLSGSIPD